jgi:hypothetical protein
LTASGGRSSSGFGLPGGVVTSYAHGFKWGSGVWCRYIYPPVFGASTASETQQIGFYTNTPRSIHAGGYRIKLTWASHNNRIGGMVAQCHEGALNQHTIRTLTYWGDLDGAGYTFGLMALSSNVLGIILQGGLERALVTLEICCESPVFQLDKLEYSVSSGALYNLITSSTDYRIFGRNYTIGWNLGANIVNASVRRAQAYPDSTVHVSCSFATSGVIPTQTAIFSMAGNPFSIDGTFRVCLISDTSFGGIIPAVLLYNGTNTIIQTRESLPNSSSLVRYYINATIIK